MQLRQHMAEHKVVPMAEYGPNDGADYFARKRAAREDFLTGGPRAQEAVKSDVLSAVEKVSAGYKPKIQSEGVLNE